MLGLVQVPSTSEAVDGKGVYTVFDVHLNGNYHGSARYSQFLAFHQELKAKYDLKGVEEFPGKHWFSSLSSEQVFARRVGLERYLHSLAQDKQIGVSSDLKEFFIAMQRSCSELSEETVTELSLEVFLVNGKSVTVQVDPFLRTDQVLEGVASQIQLAKHLTYYFNLYLEKQEGEEQTWTVIRPLTDFECPYISLQTLNKTSPHRVTIRKNFWDKAVLAEILADRVGKNLMYIESLCSVTSGHWDIPTHTRKQLATFQKKSQKKEYVELVGSLPQYGFVQLDGFVLDHPEELYTVSVRVGKLEMVTYVLPASGKEQTSSGNSRGGASPAEGSGDLVKVHTYPLTKIRSWKVGGKWNTPSPSWKAPWLKLFYQGGGAADFVPVTMQGPQAIFLSNCLHSIVNELLRLRSSQDTRRPTDSAIDRMIYNLPKVVFYEPPEILQDRREGKDLVKDEEQTDTASSSAPDTPTTSTPSTTATPSIPSASQEPSTQTTPAAKTTPTTTPTMESKPIPGEVTKPSKTTRSFDPALLSKAKQQVMAIINKRDSTTPSAVENPTFQFGTDDDL